MLRKIFFTGLTVMTMASTSQAAILMSTVKIADLAGGFTSWTLHAHSTAGEIINGVDTPTIVQGMALTVGFPARFG